MYIKLPVSNLIHLILQVSGFCIDYFDVHFSLIEYKHLTSIKPSWFISLLKLVLEFKHSL